MDCFLAVDERVLCCWRWQHFSWQSTFTNQPFIEMLIADVCNFVNMHTVGHRHFCRFEQERHLSWKKGKTSGEFQKRLSLSPLCHNRIYSLGLPHVKWFSGWVNTRPEGCLSHADSCFCPGRSWRDGSFKQQTNKLSCAVQTGPHTW